MIVICGDVIRNKILQKIREAKFFSIIADEATDSANDEQLSISIRFLDNNVPQEKFLGFHESLSGVSREAIANNIITQLVNWQLDPHLLRGQPLMEQEQWLEGQEGHLHAFCQYTPRHCTHIVQHTG